MKNDVVNTSGRARPGTTVAKISEYLSRFDAGEFNDKKVVIQCAAGWFDWFCTDKALRNKTYRLTAKLKQLMPSTKINPDTMYVMFKNNMSIEGDPYDDFRICNMETDDVIYCIIPSNAQHHSEVWGLENQFKTVLIKGKWTDVKRYFKYPSRRATVRAPHTKSYEVEKFRPRLLRPILQKEDK